MNFFCNPLNKKGDGVNSTQGRGRRIQKARGFGRNIVQGVAAMRRRCWRRMVVATQSGVVVVGWGCDDDGSPEWHFVMRIVAAHEHRRDD
jgi:hypothetical protein